MEGIVSSGRGRGATFVSDAANRLKAATGFDPYPGTLNLRGPIDCRSLPTRALEGDWSDHCDRVTIRRCCVRGVTAAVVRPDVPDYPEAKTELLAPVSLRQFFGLEDGDSLAIAHPTAARPLTEASVTDRMDLFDGVVFDLDATLVDLDVDWGAVHDAIDDRLGEYCDHPICDYERTELFETAREHDVYDDLDEMITAHERSGVATVTDLPLLSVLKRLECPVGICTANASSAARRALEKYGADDHIDVIVGRETVPEQKPRPEPLAACAEGLGVSPPNALFVGDESTDAAAARALEMSYVHPREIALGPRT